MLLLSKRSYEKPEPHRDATIFIVVCEGSNREPDYFDYFDELSSKIKVKAVPSQDGKSSPNYLIDNSKEAVKKYNSDHGDYSLWIVTDVDKWIEHGHIYELQKQAKDNNWEVVISNPCFEVWLSSHFTKQLPHEKRSMCKSWKTFIPTIQNGGFDCDRHPSLIEIAIKNSSEQFEEVGYIPKVGSTQIFRLGQKIFDLVKIELQKLL